MLDASAAWGYNEAMARTRGRAKRREQPLGVAIGLGLAATLAVGVLIGVILLLIPGTVVHQFFSLVHNASSATLPLDPLYQEWAEKIAREDVLFVSPLSLLCGGLVFGWFAPSYVARRRTLLSGAALGFGVLAAVLAFIWLEASKQQTLMNHNEGGQQVILTAPPEFILLQALCIAVWTALCILGTWLGLTLRDRARSRQGAEPAGQPPPRANARPLP